MRTGSLANFVSILQYLELFNSRGSISNYKVESEQ